MNPFSQTFQARWADMDPNHHMRHSAYTDYAAQVRLAFFYTNDIDVTFLKEHNCGPVLFREDTRFFKEVRLNEMITVDLRLAGGSQDGGRWIMVHDITKASGETAAKITVTGAWIDLAARKLITPPKQVLSMINRLVKTDDYQEIVPRK